MSQTSNSMINSFEEITKTARGEMEAAFCIIVNTKGSTPRKKGAKMIVYEDGSIKGTIGGGALEERVILDAVRVMRDGSPELTRHDLLHQHSMCCGGSVDIYIEPVEKKPDLYIFGAGHTGQALAAL